MTLSDFLLARIAEDVALAREATPGPWSPYAQGFCDKNGAEFITSPYHELDIERADAEHIARYNPARVLAECEAKPRIVERHSATRWTAEGMEFDLCDECSDQVWPCPTLRFLALPYADHPDYQEAWKP